MDGLTRRLATIRAAVNSVAGQVSKKGKIATQAILDAKVALLKEEFASTHIMTEKAAVEIAEACYITCDHAPIDLVPDPDVPDAPFLVESCQWGCDDCLTRR
jgi:hypothetical protein